MAIRLAIFRIFYFLTNFCVFFSTYAADKKPCEGPYGFIDLVNRPSIANSPCTVPNKEWVLEGGYRYKKLISSGDAQRFPFANPRFGLPGNNEIFALVPTYTTQNKPPLSGFDPTSIGLKHEFFTKHKLTVSGLSFISPPSGSKNFGTKGWSGYLSSIFDYALTDKISLLGEFSLTTTTEPPVNGGQRYSSFNPDVLITYNPKDYIEIFAEIYGQTKTGYNQGSGFIGHLVMIYLINKNWTIDFEAGQRFYGLVLGIERFIGAGSSIKF